MYVCVELIGPCADVPDMPGNVTVEKTGSSTVLLSADSPPVKPVTEHGGVDVISWVVTYQAETEDAVPMGRESRATFSSGGRIQIASSLIKLSTQFGSFVTLKQPLTSLKLSICVTVSLTFS